MAHVVPQEPQRFTEGEIAGGAFLSLDDAYQEALRLLEERKRRLEPATLWGKQGRQIRM